MREMLARRKQQACTRGTAEDGECHEENVLHGLLSLIFQSKHGPGFEAKRIKSAAAGA